MIEYPLSKEALISLLRQRALMQSANWQELVRKAYEGETDEKSEFYSLKSFIIAEYLNEWADNLSVDE